MALRLTLDNEKQFPDGGPTTFAPNGKRAVEIGRDPFRDWVLTDPTRVVSGKHCEIKWQDGNYWLSDTSTNGTFVNGSEQRVQSPARLRHGDRLTIGPYIVAVAIDDQEPAGASLPRAGGLDALWGDASIAPPIDANLLKPRPPRAEGDDYLDRAVDLPWVDRAGAAPARAAAADPNADWLSSLARPASPSPPPAAAPAPATPSVTPRPSPHFPDAAANPWLTPPPAPEAAPLPPPPPPEAAPLVAERVAPPPEAAPAPPIALPPKAPALAPPEAPALDPMILRRFAQGAGLPPGLIEGRDAGDFAESLGALVRQVAGHVKALLDARQSAKRLSRTVDHTTIGALDNNPLKFSPTVEDALAIMFGPPRRSYLDATRCFESSFEDLAEHQLLTFSAMQRAIQLMQKDLEPAGIEAGLGEDKGLAAIMGSRHARLWQAYAQRWKARTERFDDGLVGAFLRDFAACYDDPQKGK